MNKLPTVILNSDCKYINKKDKFFKFVDIEPNQQTLNGLIETLEWAIDNEEPYIFIVNEHSRLCPDHFENIHPVLAHFSNDGICCLLIDVLSENIVPMTNNLSLVENISLIKSCLLLDSVYDAFLEYLYMMRNENQHLTFTSLIKIVCPHKLVWVKQQKHFSEIKINIIVPFRNCESYIEETIDSILNQDYENLKVYFIDDCSTDKTYFKIPDKHPKIVKTQNMLRRNSLYNVCNTIINNNFTPDSIICILDGDDILSHRYVLKIINAYYSLRKKTLATYGTMGILGDDLNQVSLIYSEEEFYQIRRSKWKLLPFRTFRSSLFHKYLSVDPELTYMKDTTGNYYEMTSDMALMFSLFELCDYDNVVFVDTPLYLYRLHSNNDHIKNRHKQLTSEHEIRNKRSLRTIA